MFIFIIAYIVFFFTFQHTFADWHFLGHAFVSIIPAWVVFVLIDDHLRQE